MMKLPDELDVQRMVDVSLGDEKFREMLSKLSVDDKKKIEDTVRGFITSFGPMFEAMLECVEHPDASSAMIEEIVEKNK